MIAIVCLDETGGMMFNGRRQSRDRVVTERIRELCQGKILWMNAYSYKIYGNLDGVEVRAAEDFLARAGEGEWCLVETESLGPVLEKVEELHVFWWNRRYPADFRLDVDLEVWVKAGTAEFPGNSHEKITEEFYRKREETG